VAPSMSFAHMLFENRGTSPTGVLTLRGGGVRQDCLLQWLQHSNKDSCELCKYKFIFRPVYAEGAPQTVSFQQVRSIHQVTWCCIQ
jgi:hypothetical protein